MGNMQQYMDFESKMSYIMDSYNTLRARSVVRTWSDFALLLGVNRTCLSAAKQGNENYLTDSLISKIHGLMKEYDRSVSVNNSPGTNVVNGDNNNVEIGNHNGISSLGAVNPVMRYVPTIPIHAYRAINFDVMEYFRSTKDELHMSPIIMQFPGTDCYYFVNSEDMSPNLRTNDLLCLSRLPDDAKVTNGDLCIINTKYQGILERFVYDEGDSLLLKSTQPRWTDMMVPKDEVFSVFRILGGIRTNI